VSRKPNAAREYISGLATEDGRRSQHSALRVLARLLTGNPSSDPYRISWQRLTFVKANRIRAALLQREYAPSTANRLLTALRRTLRTAWRLGLMSQEDFARAADLEPIRGKADLAGRALDGEEVEALYRSCLEDGSALGARDGAAIALMHAAGLRRGEAAELEVEGVDRATGELAVTGKGRKFRRTYLGEGLGWVMAWIDARGDAPGPLLQQVRNGLVIDRPTPLSAQALCDIVSRRAKAAGIERVTPHDLRRTFATELLDVGDVLMVQKLLGHASADTTGRYDRRELAKMRALQGRLRVPRPPHGSPPVTMKRSGPGPGDPGAGAGKMKEEEEG
jgi:site-specific recombinase XerD